MGKVVVLGYVGGHLYQLRWAVSRVDQHRRWHHRRRFPRAGRDRRAQPAQCRDGASARHSAIRRRSPRYPRGRTPLLSLGTTYAKVRVTRRPDESGPLLLPRTLHGYVTTTVDWLGQLPPVMPVPTPWRHSGAASTGSSEGSPRNNGACWRPIAGTLVSCSAAGGARSPTSRPPGRGRPRRRTPAPRCRRRPGCP